MQSSNPIRAVLGLLIVGAIVYFTFFAGGYGSKVTNGHIEVYYKDGASKEEAERLAAHIAKVGAATEKSSVQLTKNGDAYRYRMVVKPEFRNDPKFLANVGIFGAQIAREVFNGAPFELEVCDERLNTVKAVPIPAEMRHRIARGKIEVYHSDLVAGEGAGKLLEFVEREFANAPAPLISFTLNKRAETFLVKFGFKTEMLKQPEVLAEPRNIRERISKTVFGGSPVELSTCDDSFNVTETFKP